MNREIVDQVRQGAADALDKTEATAESAKEGILEAIGRVSEMFQTLRGLGLDDVLSTIGLQRRRSPWLAISMFGAGIAAGAVVGLALAPRSGKASRELLRRRFAGALDKSEDAMHTAMDKATDKARAAADGVKEKAHDVSSKLEHTVENIPGFKKAEAAVATNGRTR